MRAWVLATALAAIVVGLDQATKQAVIAHVRPNSPVDLIFGFHLANVRNKGVAFGLLAGGEGLVLALTLGALGLLIVYFAFDVGRPHLWAAVGLVVGGALANLTDRVRVGYVIDFVDPPLWPAFNLADVAIVLGVVMLVLAHHSPARAHGRPG